MSVGFTAVFTFHTDVPVVLPDAPIGVVTYPGTGAKHDSKGRLMVL